MRKETIRDVINILIKWNSYQMSCEEAINEIFELFMKDKDKELQTEWMNWQKQRR